MTSRRRNIRVARWTRRLRTLRDTEAAQLLEFALVLPLLVVLAVSASDVSGAWALKDKLTNAAREGARIAVSQTNDLNSGNDPPASVTAVRDTAANYLTNANVTTCAVGTSPSSSGTDGGTAKMWWQYTSSSTGCGAFLLKIDRGYTFTVGMTTLVGTQVTLAYPFSWKFGAIFKLLAPASNFDSSVTISTSAVMQNLT